jgi:hypothetical protein
MNDYTMTDDLYRAQFGELRSACAARQLTDIEALLRTIILHAPDTQSLSALHYAMRLTAHPMPWRWSWWAMFLEEGRAPTAHPSINSESFTL